MTGHRIAHESVVKPYDMRAPTNMREDSTGTLASEVRLGRQVPTEK